MMTRHSSAMPAVHAPKPKRRNVLAELVRSREATLFVVLIALIAATAAVKPEFLNLQNLRDVLLNVSIIGLLTAGMTVVMLMRHIDLSVASVVGVSAYSVGALYVMFPHMPIIVAMLASTLYIVRGADYAWVHGGQINATSLPDAFSRIATGSLLGIPNLVLIAVVVLVAIGVYLKQYRGGREHYAIGSNPEAARLAGIQVERRVMIGFLLSGAIAGLAGVLWLARFGTVDASTAKGIELQVVAAAVVGSVAITGGVGTIMGATLGALVLGVINIALVVLRVSPFWQQAIQGALIVAAIALDTMLARSVARRMMRKRDHG
jgi:rhamnose transport system permease protein